MNAPIRKVALAVTLRSVPASGLASLLALGAFASSGAAAAEVPRDPNVMNDVIVLGAGARPEYEGADHLSPVDYARTYFSVDETGAALSGLESFDADGGLHDIGLGVNLRYALNRRLSVSGLLSRRQLLGDAADSPIVTDEGSAGQTFVAASLGWRF